MQAPATFAGRCLRVELGFDAKAHAALRLACPSLPKPDVKSAGDFLHQVYISNYDRAFDVAEFHASLSSLNLFVPWMIRVSRLNYHAHLRPLSVSRGVLAGLRTLCLATRAGDAVKAIFATLPLTVTFEKEMWTGIDRTAEDCRRLLATKLESLENVNLDTGEFREDEHYPPAIRTKSLLADG